MDDALMANSPVLFLFLYLLPGFVGMVVYGFLVEGEPRDTFDRLVTAFVLSLLAALCVHFVVGEPLVPVLPVTAATPMSVVLQGLIDRDLLYCSIVAMLSAIVMAFLNNHGMIYEVINRLKISYKISNTDVWRDVFYRHRGFWVKLEFSDGRTLLGWPKYFSATGKPREMFVADATWSTVDEDGVVTSMDVAGPGVYLPDLNGVTNLEILKGN